MSRVGAAATALRAAAGRLATGWGDDDHDGDGVFARGLDSHGGAVAVTTRTREHLVRRRHPSVMCAFPPARAPEVIADARAPDEVDRRATPRDGHTHRRRF